MQVRLFGAAYEVTGSCYLLESGKTRLLVDCGMFQGRLEKQNHIPREVQASELNAVLLTHGHLDHCGRLPLLVKAGFNGPIFATPGTIDISMLILRDAARIQLDDIERENRKRKLAGLKPCKPLFSVHDVEQVLKQFSAVKYNEWTPISNNSRARFVEAGHILGSASIELAVEMDENPFHLVFSGDIGQWNTPIVRDPTIIERADIAFVESTYGDRDHRSLADTVDEFEQLLKQSLENQGKILIPTFAVGRAQEILYHLAEIFRRGSVEPFPIFLDSPMALAATILYANHPELMDEEALRLRNSGQLRKDLSTLRICESVEESQALNDFQGPCLILAGSGMCNGGRILHHLKHNLALSKTSVIIVGYQARGSLGRQLVEGAEQVRIHGETVPVNATITSLGGFSAHAGQSELIRWMHPMASNGAKIVLTHGESFPIDQLAQKVREEFGIKAMRPKLKDVIHC